MAIGKTIKFLGSVAAVSTGIAAVMPFSIAGAQQIGGVVEEIVVTATRREERSIDTPVSVSVVDSESAVRSGITDINGIADFIPSLQAQDGGAPSLGNLVIRGIYAGGAPTVGTYIDDVPYGAVVGSFASSQALDASLYDLNRIEIVRGPQGTLFGASAVGGVVRYVTKRPNRSELEGYGTVDYSSTSDGSNNTLIRGRISGPLVEDRFALDLSGYVEDFGGYIDSAVTGDDDINDHEFSGGRLSGEWAVSDRVTINGSVVHHEADYDSAGYVSFDPTTGQPVFGDLQTEFAAPRDLEFDLLSLTADIDLGFATLTSVTSDQTLELTNVSDVTPQLGPLLPGSTITLNSGSEVDRFTQELRLTSDGDGEGIDWIVGVYYTKQESDEFQVTVEDPPVVNLINLVTEQEYTELAVFGNVTYYISPKWDVTVGLRWSDNENDITNLFTGALSNPLLNDLNTVSDDTVTTWLLNTRYQISDEVNFYARAASGYRPGGSNLVIDVGGMVFGNPTYDADDLWSYEAGVKGTLSDGRLYYDIGAYYIDWSDAQIQFVNPITGLTETGNAMGGITAQGLEATLSGQVTDNFLVTAALAWNDAELDNDEPNLGGLSGESLAGLPDLTIALSGDYVFSLSGDRDLTIGATWRHSGDYNSNFSQAPTGNYNNPSYSHFDVRVGLQISRFAFNLYATNVTDEDDFQTVFPVAPTFAYGVVLRPRTIGLNVRVDF